MDEHAETNRGAEPRLLHIPQSPLTEGHEPKNCRSCGARVWWAINVESGKKNPIDHAPDPSGRGNIIFVPVHDFDLCCRYLKRGEKAPVGEPLYTNHFATCPNRDEHRRAGAPAGCKPLVPAAQQAGLFGDIAATANNDPQSAETGVSALETLEARISALSDERNAIVGRIRHIQINEIWPGEREAGAAGRRIGAIRVEELFPLEERDRHFRGAYAAGAHRPVGLRLGDRAKERRAS